MKLSEGCLLREAAAAVGISKQALQKRMAVSPEFAQAVVAAREAGAAERRYRRWLYHPFRGCRPPTGKGHGASPRSAMGGGDERRNAIDTSKPVNSLSASRLRLGWNRR